MELVLLELATLCHFGLKNCSNWVGFVHINLYASVLTLSITLLLNLWIITPFLKDSLFTQEGRFRTKLNSQLCVLQPLIFILLASLFDQHETQCPVANRHSWYSPSSDIFMFSVLINRTFINLCACLTTEGNNCCA